MIIIRKSKDRGHATHGWLESYHSFSFADYYDPDHTGFRDLLVINEDKIQAGQGFGRHGHRDMEIITYVLEGALEHKDSMGTGSVLRPGDVQRMSAGTGVHHSEFNASKTDLLHLLQIWISPEATGSKPGYEEKHFSTESRHNQLCLIASHDGREGSVRMHQNAALYATLLDVNRSVTHRFASDGPGRRSGWIQLARGSADLNGTALSAGDGAAISDEAEIELKATSPVEALLFDLP